MMAQFIYANMCNLVTISLSRNEQQILFIWNIAKKNWCNSYQAWLTNVDILTKFKHCILYNNLQRRIIIQAPTLLSLKKGTDFIPNSVYTYRTFTPLLWIPDWTKLWVSWCLSPSHIFTNVMLSSKLAFRFDFPIDCHYGCRPYRLPPDLHKIPTLYFRTVGRRYNAVIYIYISRYHFQHCNTSNRT